MNLRNLTHLSKCVPRYKTWKLLDISSSYYRKQNYMAKFFKARIFAEYFKTQKNLFWDKTLVWTIPRRTGTDYIPVYQIWNKPYPFRTRTRFWKSLRTCSVYAPIFHFNPYPSRSRTCFFQNQPVPVPRCVDFITFPYTRTRTYTKISWKLLNAFLLPRSEEINGQFRIKNVLLAS